MSEPCVIMNGLRLFPWRLSLEPIQIQSSQYDEEPKRGKTQGEMTDIMAQELTNLPQFTAYAKVINEQDGRQSVYKGKIQTYPIEYAIEDMSRKGKRVEEIKSYGFITSAMNGLTKKRDDIEAEIRERQKKWRSMLTSPTPAQPTPTPKPPPTSD
jgi:hypothetical protein